MQTHYDNLKISRNATDDEIRAAYRRLSKQYHPDYNDSPDALRIMQIVNRAYEVLSDPVKRAEHNAWIDAQNCRPSTPEIFTAYKYPNAEQRNYFRWWISGFIVLCFIALLWFFIPSAPKTKISSVVYAANPLAPNGSAWPDHAAYVAQYPYLTDGSNNLSVVNPDEKTALMVQIYGQSLSAYGALRTVFIPADDSFAIEDLPPDTYYLRFMRLDNGRWAQSPHIVIKENVQYLLQP